MNLKEINIVSNEGAFKEALKKGIHLVTFGAIWSQQASKQLKILEDVNSNFGENVSIHYVDIDEHMDLAVEYKASSIPFIVLMKDNEIHESFSGVYNQTLIEDKIRAIM